MPHIHEHIDYTADVFVVEGDAVLLRMHDKYHFWSVPGGHIELDELPTEGAIREVKEEVGLDVEIVGEVPPITEGGEYQELIPPRYMNVHAISETHKHISFIYFARAHTREVVEIMECEKSSDIRWFTREELDDPVWGLKETIQFYARAALDAVR